MKNWVLYVVAGLAALVVVTGVGGLTAYLVISKMAPVAGEARPAATAEAGTAVIVSLKPFTTNLGDTDRPRYISVTFELGAADEKDAERLNAQLPEIRDQILQILNSKRSMEVTGDSGSNKLKNEVQERLNARLGPVVKNVWISDLVVQF